MATRSSWSDSSKTMEDFKHLSYYDQLREIERHLVKLQDSYRRIPSEVPSYEIKEEEPEADHLQSMRKSSERAAEIVDRMKRWQTMSESQNFPEATQDSVAKADHDDCYATSNLGANSEEQNCEMVYSSTKESIADLVGDFGHSRFEVGEDARRPKTMEDKEIEFSTQRFSAKSFQGNHEQQFQETSASINFGLSPNLRSGIDEIVESEPTAYLHQTPALPSFLMEEDTTRMEFPQKIHQSSGSSESSLGGNSTYLKVIHIASEEISEWIDASFDSIEIREADLKLNSMEFLVTFLAHKVYAKMLEKQKADVDDYVELSSTFGDVFGSIDFSSSFVFDPGKGLELSSHIDRVETILVFDPGGDLLSFFVLQFFLAPNVEICASITDL